MKTLNSKAVPYLDPKFVFYCRFQLVENGKKPPKYKMAKAVGYYPPLQELVGKDGNVSVYLVQKPANSAEDAPKVKLQAKNSLNLTGLKNYFVDGGKVSMACYGNPPSGDTYGGKKPRPNPFKDCGNDAFLFLLDGLREFEFEGGKMEIPQAFEMFVVSGGKALGGMYCQALSRGGLDAEVEAWRQQAITINL